DAIAAGGGGGQFPFAPDEGKKRFANPVTDHPDTHDRLTGPIIDRPQRSGHFGERLGSAHRRTRAQVLTFAVVVLPPKGDPVPASTRLAFLQAAALETPPAQHYGFHKNR